MTVPRPIDDLSTRILHWVARLSALAAIVPILLIAIGESGSGPSGP